MIIYVHICIAGGGAKWDNGVVGEEETAKDDSGYNALEARQINNSGTLTPLIDNLDTHFSTQLPSTLHKLLHNFDSLLSIRYTSKATIKPCWFLVRINKEKIKTLKINSMTTGCYHVTFFFRQLIDNNVYE